MGDNLERADLREILAGECTSADVRLTRNRHGTGRNQPWVGPALRAMAEVERRALASALAQRDEAVAAEREACAQIADVFSDEKDVMALESADDINIAAYREGERTANDIAAAIRARTEGHGGGE